MVMGFVVPSYPVVLDADRLASCTTPRSGDTATKKSFPASRLPVSFRH
jgi:hypothetical protein